MQTYPLHQATSIRLNRLILDQTQVGGRHISRGACDTYRPELACARPQQFAAGLQAIRPPAKATRQGRGTSTELACAS